MTDRVVKNKIAKTQISVNKYIPRDTGELARNFICDDIGTGKWKVHFDNTNRLDGHKNLTNKKLFQYLNSGTRPHDIPHAFDKPLPFGIGGQFNGKFHPGSRIHRGIGKFLFHEFLNHLAGYLNGEIKVGRPAGRPNKFE